MATTTDTRDAYLDAVRLLAIVRVVVFHVLRWGWLTVLFPSMGVMFALGGTLMARSVERRQWRAVIDRCHRMLPSLWLLATVIVPLMVFIPPIWVPNLSAIAAWFVPFVDPTGPVDFGILWEPLWYLRAYLWFVLLSPLLYAAYKRAPLVVAAIPVAAFLLLPDARVLYDGGGVRTVLLDLYTYGGCWIIGFAAHRGDLAKISVPVTSLAILILGIVGGAEIFGRASNFSDLELITSPVANGCWSAAFALGILRFRPGARLIEGARRLHAMLRRSSGRSLTVYLWHGPIIYFASQLLGAGAMARLVNSHYTPPPSVWLLMVTVGGLAVVATTVGRVETIGHKRRSAVR